MATIAEWKAMQRAGLLRRHSEGDISANELFPALLDTFSAEGLLEELEAAETPIRERIREFLTGHRPATFRQIYFGVGPTPEEAVQEELERRCKYAALLIALGVKEPRTEMGT
jgi:hypothetical protein